MIEQLLLHAWGDYLTQSDWMAQNKTKAHFPAFCHALLYSLPFLLIGSVWAFLVIFGTHFFIDRYRLARFVVYAKNFIAPKHIRYCDYGCGRVSQAECCGAQYFRRNHPWSDCSATGYHKDVPPFLAVWLLIIADNVLHLTINYGALRWL